MIALVYAASLNGVIGDKGVLPWHVPSDLKRFKEVTMGKPVIMGRKTWDSLPKRPLPGRQNIILTREKGYRAEGADVAQDIDAALRLAGGAAEICVIGGAEVFKTFLPKAGRVYLTRIMLEVEGDVVMPPLDSKTWREVSRSQPQRGEKDDAAFKTVVFERR